MIADAHKTILTQGDCVKTVFPLDWNALVLMDIFCKLLEYVKNAKHLLKTFAINVKPLTLGRSGTLLVAPDAFQVLPATFWIRSIHTVPHASQELVRNAHL